MQSRADRSSRVLFVPRGRMSRGTAFFVDRAFRRGLMGGNRGGYNAAEKEESEDGRAPAEACARRCGGSRRVATRRRSIKRNMGARFHEKRLETACGIAVAVGSRGPRSVLCNVGGFQPADAARWAARHRCHGRARSSFSASLRSVLDGSEHPATNRFRFWADWQSDYGTWEQATERMAL